MRRAPHLCSIAQYACARTPLPPPRALTPVRLRTVSAALARGWAGPAVASGVPFPSPLFLRRKSIPFAAKMPRIMIKGGVWRNTEVGLGSFGWGPGSLCVVYVGGGGGEGCSAAVRRRGRRGGGAHAQ